MTKGHNNPPEQTPFEAVVDAVDDLYMEAQNWLDGDAVENKTQADNIAKLIQLARKAGAQAAAAHKVEKAPHLAAGREVDGRYKPLREKIDRVSNTCKTVLAPWLERIEAEKRAEEAERRRQAEEAERKAQEELRASQQSGDILEREKAEVALKAARDAEKQAKKANRDTARASGGAGRSIGLRACYTPEIEDLNAAVQFYWKTDRAAFEALVLKLAKEDVRAGRRTIPGIKVTVEKRAV